jgi:hypothetical protein
LSIDDEVKEEEEAGEQEKEEEEATTAAAAEKQHFHNFSLSPARSIFVSNAKNTEKIVNNYCGCPLRSRVLFLIFFSLSKVVYNYCYSLI